MKLVLTVLKYLVLVNVVLFLVDELLGIDLDFNLVSNVTIPVVCALGEWEMKKQRQLAEK